MDRIYGTYKNNKTEEIYSVYSDNILNCTDKQEGQEMVLYWKVSAAGKYLVREKTEFLNKFTKT